MSHGWLDKLDNRAGHYSLLLVVGASLFLINLGGPTLWDVDEGRNATAAYEMMEAGNWVVPTFNGELRVDKPALLYWLQIWAFRSFGINEFAARLPSALAALCTLLVCYELARGMFNAPVGLLAGLMTATTPMLCGAARFANPDALLNLFTCLTLWVFWVGLPGRRGWWYAAVGASAGTAVLAKGPVGLVLPAAAAMLFLLWTRQLGVLRTRRAFLGVGAFLLVAGPWYVWVAIETKATFLRGFLLTHNVNRFLAPMENHGQGPWFYLLVVALGLAPWSLFLGLAGWYGGWSAVRRPWTRFADTWRRAADPADNGQRTMDAYRYLWCWIAVYILFFSLAATKLPNYILPLVVPLVVLVARFGDRWRRGEIAGHLASMRLCAVLLGAGALLVSAGLLIVGGAIPIDALDGRVIPALALWATIGVVPLLCAPLAWRFLRRGQRTRFLGCLVVSTVVFLVPLLGWAVNGLNDVKPIRPLVEHSGAGDRLHELRIVAFELEHLPSLNFYCQRDVAHLRTEQDVVDALAAGPVFLFTSATSWQRLAPSAPTVCRVVARGRDLYRGQDVVVVADPSRGF